MKLKAPLAILAGLSIAVVPFAGLAAAQATTVNIVMFSLEGITDPAEEDTDMAAALASLGTVTNFDGGDGSAGAWTAALASADALVLPESDNDDGLLYGSAHLSAGAVTVIHDYIAAGHTVIGTGGYTSQGLIDDLTGITRTWEDDGLEDDGVWNLQVESDVLPATLPNANYAGGIDNWADWTDPQKVGVTPLYLNTEETNAGVATFTIGRGAFIYYGYDWYPEEEDVTSGAREAWNEALRLGASGAFTDAVNPVSTDLALDLSLDLEVGEVVAGATVVAQASGLKAGSPWDLVLRSTPITLDSGLVGTNGSVLSTVTIPEGLEVGTHTITITGTSADGVAYMRFVTFVIGADGTLASVPVLSDLTQVPAPSLASTGVSAAVPFALAAFALLAGLGVLAFRRKATA